MEILFIDAAGPFGGAARSLFELIKELSGKHGINIKIIMQNGTAKKYYEQITKDIITVPGLTRFDNTRLTSYKGFRLLVLFRELFYLPYSIFSVIRAKIIWRKIDLIHVNEITDIITALFAQMLFRVPIVIHVRSLQNSNHNSIRSKWVYKQLNKASAVIAIDENVRASLPAYISVEVIHNSFSSKSLKTEDNLSYKLKCLREKSLKIGFVGNLHVMKGVYELVEAINILRQEGVDVECIVAGGETRSDHMILKYILKILGLGQNVGKEIKSMILEYGIADSVHLLGPVDNIQCVYETLDLILFPSYYDAPGRPVFEAAFYAVPSIVCVNKAYPDTFLHGETGISVPPKNPKAIAEAIAYFYYNRAELNRMGCNAERLAKKNFIPSKNAIKVHNIYRYIIEKSNNY